jgi:hypothetical protein
VAILEVMTVEEHNARIAAAEGRRRSQTMKSRIFQARHGDILIQAVKALPEGATRKPAVGVAVLAEGEQTGHAHTLTGAALQLWELGNRLFAEVPEGGVLNHQEHGVIQVPPGVYEVVRQRVYTPEEIRYVAD